HGLLICIPFSIFVIVSFVSNPRLWLHSLPPDIAKCVHPKTGVEKKITYYVLMPIFLLILPGLSVVSVLYLSTIMHLSFVAILVHMYIVWITVHLWDLFVIDGIAMFIIDPQKPPIAGTEGADGWSNFNFHIRDFLKAIIMSLLFVVPVSLILWIVL
ncbi:MAG: putative rane protein, partial [Flavipsychrobacter sp.]|nr:putative rane protein [Flavipsychrobacter sp.]